MRHLFCVIISVCCAISIFAAEMTEQTFTVHKQLPFTSAPEQLTLDLYIPKGVKGPVPCIMVIQGGGFKAQNGQKFKPYAEYLAQHNFAAALISYRGLSKHTYRDTIADTKAAVRYVRSVSEQYGINSDKIGAMGRSAGGTLAVLLAVTGDVKDLEGKRGHEKHSSRIQAGLGIAGVYDFIGRFTDKEQIALQPGMERKIKSNGQWIGAAYSETNADWLNASAINHLDKMDPPVLLLHCKNDNIVPWMQSRDFHAAMQKNGLKSESVITDKGGHSGPKDTKALMLKFFKKTLSE